MLLREWAAKKYPQFHLMEQVRLGPTSATLNGVLVSPALQAMLRVNNWYSDGAIILPNELLIIESKMRPDPRAVGQVLFYMRLSMSTPELQSAMALPARPVVLFSEDDPEVNQFARTWGCRVEVYTPAWIEDYLTQVQFRARPHVQRAASMEPAAS